MATLPTNVPKPPLAELPIATLSALFAKLQNTEAKTVAKSATAVKFWDKVERKFAIHKAEGPSSIHSLLRLLFPARDTERTFGLKEQALAKSLVAALGLTNVEGSDGYALLNWESKASAGICPFAAIVSQIIPRRSACNSSAQLTLGELNERLDELAQAPSRVRKDILMRLYLRFRLTCADVFFLTCVVLKLDWGGKTMLKLMLNAVRDGAYDAGRPFEHMCLTAIDPLASRSSDFGVFTPTAQPMRATTTLHVWDKLAASPGFSGDVLVETKTDGWRLQVHVRKDGLLHVFTHSGRPASSQLGEHAAYFGQVGGALHAALAHNGGERGSIFDCEVVVVHDGRVEPFGSVGSLRGLTDGERSGRRHHRLVVFDLLVDDGEVALGWTLRARRARLEALVRAPNDWVQLSDASEARWLLHGLDFHGVPAPSAPRECPLQRAMARAIARACEGIVVKSLDSTYAAGDVAGWVKLKRCYNSALADEIHLVILGLNYGSGRRVDRLTKCVLGALDTDGAPEGAGALPRPLRYRRICETGCGLNGAEIADVQRRFRATATLDARAQPNAPLPAWCAGSSWQRNRPALLLCDASHALPADVVVSGLFPVVGGGPLGFSLRFPRISRLKADRDASAAHSLAQLRMLFQSSRLFSDDWKPADPATRRRDGDESRSDGDESWSDGDEIDESSDAEEAAGGAPAPPPPPPPPSEGACALDAERAELEVLQQLRESDRAYARTHGRPLYGARRDSPACSAPLSPESTPPRKRGRLEASCAGALAEASSLGRATVRARADVATYSDLELGLVLPESEAVRNRRWPECVFWLDTNSMCEVSRDLHGARLRALGASVVEQLDDESRWRVTHIMVDGAQSVEKRTRLMKLTIRAIRSGERQPPWTFFDLQLFSEDALKLVAKRSAPAEAEWQRLCAAALRLSTAHARVEPLVPR
jgi:ATP-dependent DNA ligase